MNWMNKKLIELDQSDYIVLICGSTHDLQKVFDCLVEEADKVEC